ncbi:tyrosine-protein phosphatase non-receptor type 13-like isoform X1 [Varroa jacobsoni]|uniref:tyrosine-protein phosphatase non-receptor type 13-like isoform X1 n=2 Tax=Varroa jacobsoni TaxID=62625 RepID=UPI000BF966AF|nr:tyrosine-protein phosphatase non-receptor type 13-like isoform X1 [Varroa jacobsoni]
MPIGSGNILDVLLIIDMNAMPPSHPVFQHSGERVYENVPFEVLAVPPPQPFIERRHSSEERSNSRGYLRRLDSYAASSYCEHPHRRSYYNGVTPKSRSIIDVTEVRPSMSPSPEPRSVVLNSANRSRPLQRYYYPGKSEKAFHIAVPQPKEDREPQVSRSCPPIPTINIDQFYQWLENNDYRPKSRTHVDSQPSPSLTQWDSTNPERCPSQGSSRSKQYFSPPRINYLTMPQGKRNRHTSGESSNTSGSWPDLSEFANLPLTPAELEIHEVAEALNSIGSDRRHTESCPSQSVSSLNDISGNFLTADSDGGGSVRQIDSVDSCSNLSDTNVSFVTGYESIEPEYYMAREDGRSSDTSGSYVNVDTSDMLASRDRTDDISDLLRMIEMLESRCTMFLDDLLPSPSSILVPRVTSQRSPLRTHTFSFGFHSPRSLGMKVSGGFDTEFPVAVVSVEETSPAHGRIKEGDLLWSLDGVQLQGLDHQQVVQQLSNICVQRAEVTLVVLPYQGRSLELSMAKLQGVVERQTLRAMYYRVPRSYPGCTIKASLANPKKNRYSDISAYDSTRVILTPTEFNGQSDYINANYVNMSIPGTQVINRYIATQGPRSTTVEDFWQMVLEQGCQLIVMLTPLQEGNTPKCHKYWPDQDTPLRVNCLRGWDVWQTGKTQGSAWITRQFRLRCEASNEERLVKHLQYTTWPDHGAPRDSRDFIDFVHLVRDIRSEAPLAPVIVHCSAGIGRTGVLIMMETAMCLIEFGKAVWPEEMLRTMREQRAGLIQAEIQFSFVVGAILRVFFDGEVLPKNV